MTFYEAYGFSFLLIRLPTGQLIGSWGEGLVATPTVDGMDLGFTDFVIRLEILLDPVLLLGEKNNNIIRMAPINMNI